MNQKPSYEAINSMIEVLKTTPRDRIPIHLKIFFRFPFSFKENATRFSSYYLFLQLYNFFKLIDDDSIKVFFYQTCSSLILEEYLNNDSFINDNIHRQNRYYIVCLIGFLLKLHKLEIESESIERDEREIKNALMYKSKSLIQDLINIKDECSLEENLLTFQMSFIEISLEYIYKVFKKYDCFCYSFIEYAISAFLDENERFMFICQETSILKILSKMILNYTGSEFPKLFFKSFDLMSRTLPIVHQHANLLEGCESLFIIGKELQYHVFLYRIVFCHAALRLIKDGYSLLNRDDHDPETLSSCIDILQRGMDHLFSVNSTLNIFNFDDKLLSRFLLESCKLYSIVANHPQLRNNKACDCIAKTIHPLRIYCMFLDIIHYDSYLFIDWIMGHQVIFLEYLLLLYKLCLIFSIDNFLAENIVFMQFHEKFSKTLEAFINSSNFSYGYLVPLHKKLCEFCHLLHQYKK